MILEWLSIALCLSILFLVSPHLVKHFKALKKYKDLLELIPGPKPYIIFGSSFEYIVPRKYLSTVFDKRFKKYGSIIRVWNLTYVQADVFISDPEYLEIIMSSMKHICKSSAYERMQPWLGTGLLTSTGSKWHHIRKLLTPAFHFKILEDFFQVFVERSEILTAKLHKLSGEGEFNIVPIISRCTLDIICETAMGTQINIQEDKDFDHYVTTVYELNELLTYREFRVWLYPDFMFFNSPAGKRCKEHLKILHGFTEKVIKERKLQRKAKAQSSTKGDDLSKGDKRRMALLDLLLNTSDSGNPLTELEIRDEVNTFMFAGHDTVAMAITWALYLLGRHPMIQESVAQELESIFGSTKRECTIEDLNSMKYLDRVIKESLRLYPSAPMIARRIEQELSLGKYTIPADTDVTIDIYHLHRDPKLYPDPDTFNPDNFLPENIKKRHPFAYIPFSAGPRNCIGRNFALMEVKTVISTLIRNFKIEATQAAPLILLELTLKPSDGLNIKLTPRK